MFVEKLSEHGFKEALYGLGLSYSRTSCKSIDEINIDDLLRTAKTLSNKQGGHNKFLESIFVWLNVRMPRYFWQEADTYRISTKQSESTIHTITKRPLVESDFTYISESLLKELNDRISIYKTVQDKQELFREIKSLLPEGFLQQRIWSLSYKTLQNIVMQREHHKLNEWKFFISEIIRQVDHPYFIEKTD